MRLWGIVMTEYVNLEMTYTTYSKLCDAVEKAETCAEGFYEIREIVHLFDFLEEEYQRDREKQNLDYETWKLHEDLFRNKEIYHQEYFFRLESIFNDYVEKGLLEWKISEQDKFHLICELIDVFKKDETI